MGKSIIQATSGKPLRWRRGQKIRPEDVAASIATLASTLATLYSIAMELKRAWDAKKETKVKKPREKKQPE